MTLEVLNGSVCSNNREIVLPEPSTVAFNCTYENSPSSKTIYSWSMDGKVLSQFTSNMVMIPIPSGLHYVTCEVDTADSASSANCTCADSKSLNVSVVGMY